MSEPGGWPPAERGLVGGVAVPNVGGALRTMWSSLLRGREPLLPTAFAIDSVALETLFTAGPLLTAGSSHVATPVAALVISASCSLTGTLAFIALQSTISALLVDRLRSALRTDSDASLNCGAPRRCVQLVNLRAPGSGRCA